MCPGPLTAVITAQAQAAARTVEFITSVGFDDQGSAVNVEFTYKTTNDTTGALADVTLSVPLLTLLPIPYLRVGCVFLLVRAATAVRFWSNPLLKPQIKEFNLEFHAKLTGVERQSSQTSTDLHVGARYSSQAATSKSTMQAQQFDMKVHVKAVQDAAPVGLQRVLSVLEDAILFS
jgi:hypothetical protein